MKNIKLYLLALTVMILSSFIAKEDFSSKIVGVWKVVRYNKGGVWKETKSEAGYWYIQFLSDGSYIQNSPIPNDKNVGIKFGDYGLDGNTLKADFGLGGIDEFEIVMEGKKMLLQANDDDTVIKIEFIKTGLKTVKITNNTVFKALKDGEAVKEKIVGKWQVTANYYGGKWHELEKSDKVILEYFKNGKMISYVDENKKEGVWSYFSEIGLFKTNLGFEERGALKSVDDKELIMIYPLDASELVLTKFVRVN